MSKHLSISQVLILLVLFSASVLIGYAGLGILYQ